MKYSLIVPFMVTSISFVACSKSNTTPKSTNTGSPYNMNAKIDGVLFSRDSCLFGRDVIDSTRAYLVGFAGEPATRPDYYPTIRINFSDGGRGTYHGVGTYSYFKVWADLGRSRTKAETADSCLVTITSVYPKVVGTFSFITRGGTVVTDGKFSAMWDK